MIDFKQFKSKLKELGYKIKTESFSFGKMATYVHIESEEKLTFNVASGGTWGKWQPLLDYLKTVTKENWAKLKEESGLGGLEK